MRVPTASVIVAAYNSEDFLAPCLEALQAQTFRHFETIVVNSSQENRTAEIVALFTGVRFVQCSERLFPHAARNLGVLMAKGNLFVFTDADCQADPLWLAELTTAYAPGHEILGGCIDSKARSRMSRGIHLLKYSPYQRGIPPGPLDIAATGNLLVSRNAWQTIGPFDGTIFCGDALFSWKARAAGFIPWFVPTAIVTDQDEKYRSGFLSERFQRGKEFGRVRAEFQTWTRPRLLARMALAPLALLSALARIAGECRRAGRLADFLSTLPFQTAAQAAWCVGEAGGYLSLLKSRSDSR
jgi:glycosyltransferase involved in cell wall biosynthesis